MGFTFRDGTYQRRVYFGKRTIKKGMCYDMEANGSCRKLKARNWYGCGFQQLILYNILQMNDNFDCTQRWSYRIHSWPNNHVSRSLLHKENCCEKCMNVLWRGSCRLNKNDTKEKSGSNQLVETIKQGPLLFFPTTNQTLKNLTLTIMKHKQVKEGIHGMLPLVKLHLICTSERK